MSKSQDHALAKNKFEALINDIRSSSTDVSEDKIHQWAKSLQELQLFLKETSDEELEQMMDVNNKLVFSLLKLGRSQYNQDEYKPILEIIASSEEGAAGVAVVEFIKSSAGFALLNATPEAWEKLLKDEQTRKDLEFFFGGAFGLKLTNEVLASIRAEEIGCLIAYALSGNSAQDLLNFNPKKDKDKSHFILEKAKERDQEFVVRSQNVWDDLRGELTDINRSNHTGVRGRQRSDHCVLNAITQSVVLGNSTASKLAETQHSSFVSYYIAALRCTHTKTIAGRPNPLYGCKINPIYFMTGLFPNEAFDQRMNLQRDFMKYAEQAKLNNDDRKNLGQLLFMGLLGNCETKDEAVVLFAHNPIIAGCDTYDLYSLSKEVNDLLRSGNLDEANTLIKNTVMPKLTSATRALKMLLEHNELVPQGITEEDGQRYVDINKTMQALISNLTNTTQRLANTFDFSETPHLKNEFIASVGELVDYAAKNSKSRSLLGGLRSLRDSLGQLRYADHIPSLSAALELKLEERLSASYPDPFKNNTLNDTLQNVIQSMAEKLQNIDGVSSQKVVDPLIKYLKSVSLVDEGHVDVSSLKKDAFKNFPNERAISSALSYLSASLEKMGHKEVSNFVRSTRFFTSPVVQQSSIIDVDKMYKIRGMKGARPKGINHRRKQ